jgi:hypothetical protein
MPWPSRGEATGIRRADVRQPSHVQQLNGPGEALSVSFAYSLEIERRRRQERQWRLVVGGAAYRGRDRADAEEMYAHRAA